MAVNLRAAAQRVDALCAQPQPRSSAVMGHVGGT
jgi:hypothetical protein